MAIRIGELLISLGKLSQGELDAALGEQQRTGEKLGEALVRLGCVEESVLIKALAQQLRMLQVALDFTPPPPAKVLERIPAAVARRLKVVPLHLKGATTLGVVMTDPSNELQVAELHRLTGLRIEPMIAPPSQILRMIDRCYAAG